MGRHATVAGRQASSAAARSKMFTKVAREITVAARAGGSDANSNARLRLAFDHARECNMPKDTAERLAKKAAGELDGITYEECVYEGYGPSGMAVFAALQLAEKLTEDAVIVVLLPDSGRGYLSKLYNDDWMKAHNLL